MKNQVTLRLDHLTPSTIYALLEDLKEHSDSSQIADTAVMQLTEQLAALVGYEEAKKTLRETDVDYLAAVYDQS